MLSRFVSLVVLSVLSSFAAAQTCVWGSFDSTRIGYPGGVLTTGFHVGLRAAITAHGGVLAPATPTLTAAYLDGVDVFYTSLLSEAAGIFSAAEQTTLRDWVADGGTLIVTGDIFPMPAYESFTAFYGITHWRRVLAGSVGAPVATHSITAGVSSYQFASNSTFTYGPDALLLGNDTVGNPFMVVMEPATGFTSGGRLLVFGDHNLFTDPSLGNHHNTQLANNMIAWACTPLRPMRIWGSFNETRINYTGGVLTTGVYLELRNAITNSGSVLAPATPTLTEAYLDGVDVFYTSLLHNTAGVLSAAEQTALQKWTQKGGTLIVTGDIIGLAGCESFTASYGVTNWRSIGRVGNGSTVAAHPITTAVTTYAFNTNASFRYGPDAMRLGHDGAGNTFMVVLEPATGFTAGGRILVVGDHYMFTDNLFAAHDNTRLAYNIIGWAASSLCANPASWNNYGAGFPGTSGIPTFTASANPVYGSPFTLEAQSSSGLAAAGVLAVGASPASLPLFGGTLLVTPVLAVAVNVPSTGLSVPLTISGGSSVCGASFYFQVLQVDGGARFGVSFTPGLRLQPGS